jgi:hypothetical protein
MPVDDYEERRGVAIRRLDTMGRELVPYEQMVISLIRAAPDMSVQDMHLAQQRCARAANVMMANSQFLDDLRDAVETYDGELLALVASVQSRVDALARDFEDAAEEFASRLGQEGTAHDHRLLDHKNVPGAHGIYR